MTAPPILLWLRRDLRLADHPALAEAATTGRMVIPVFIHDGDVEALGAAPRWRLGLSVDAMAEALRGIGSDLVLRRGEAGAVLAQLISETGASSVWWTRLYDPASIARDTRVKAALKAGGVEARSFPGHLLHEPWDVETGQGGFYRVYTPFWNTVRNREIPAPLPAPKVLRGPGGTTGRGWPKSDRRAEWAMGAAMRRGAAVVGRHVSVGETAAAQRLATFMRHRIGDYRVRRDFPAEEATSRLSEHLTYGEISPRSIWHAGRRAMHDGAAGAEHFLKELVWREFSYHLVYHTPRIVSENWREEWDGFGWRGDNDDAERWRRGMTGEPFVDAAMREMYVTGTMHNRSRMIVASYLTKHLLTDWRVGLRWFAECLTDWDPAANALGWQWVAGSGPDAAPYFRVFNPATQAEKFDADGVYRRTFIAEGQKDPPETALAYFDAVPRRWRLSPDAPYPERLIALDAGRARALGAYERSKS